MWAKMMAADTAGVRGDVGELVPEQTGTGAVVKWDLEGAACRFAIFQSFRFRILGRPTSRSAHDLRLYHPLRRSGGLLPPRICSRQKI